MKLFFRSATAIMFLGLSFWIFSLNSCAVMVAPSGGPRDTIPPHLVSSSPQDSSLNFHSKMIQLVFDEYVNLKDVQNNLIVSPYPKNQPVVSSKLKIVTIRLRDSLLPATTYSLNFGNSIQDVNEGNPAKNFTYLFSTGNRLDSYSFFGSVFLAETGGTDSTLIVVLHRNLADSAIYKLPPLYYTRINRKGLFEFRNLPAGHYSAYVLPNDYSKRYDDSTKLFAFLDKPIILDSTQESENVVFYAYQQFKNPNKKQAGAKPGNGPGGMTPPSGRANASSKKKGGEEDKRLRVTTNLDNGKQDLINQELKFTFSRKLKSVDTSKIVLTDTFYHRIDGMQIKEDSSCMSLSVFYKWPENTSFRLLFAKTSVTDTTNTNLPKNDTLYFSTKKASDYGSLQFRFNGVDTAQHQVLLVYQTDKLCDSIPIKSNRWYRELYQPGEYSFRLLYDRNGNGTWDPGDFKQHLQPEIVKDLNRKVTLRADWSNEYEIAL